MEPVEIILAKLAERGSSVRHVGGQWMAQCPAHDDRNPSLAIREGRDGSALLTCHAGCDYTDVIGALGVTRASLFPQGTNSTATTEGAPTLTPLRLATHERHVHDYVYRDVQGRPVVLVSRYAQVDATGTVVGKTFRQYRREGERWAPGLGGITPPLYHLPDVLSAVADGLPVAVCEGEKDADRVIVELGMMATCSAMGAGKWRPEYAELFTGANVVIFADDDPPGRKHAATVRESLLAEASAVTVALPYPGCKDISEHLDAGWPLDALRIVSDGALDAPEVAPSVPVGALPFVTIKDLCAQVDAAGTRPWLLREVWPAVDYGVLAAEMKAQKTWSCVDMAVSVAGGQPWLGAVPVDQPGPVVMLAGEGSHGNLVRRLRAVCAAKSLAAEDLPITVCLRVPHLRDRGHLSELAQRLADIRPVLVTLDPLYLAARGSEGSSLYSMGEALEEVQHLCQAADAALLVITHYNRKEGKGPSRISGAGPAEWGRVLMGTQVLSRHVDAQTRETTVLSEIDIIGGEISDRTLRVLRRIRADDPTDLGSRLHYSVQTEEVSDAMAREPGQKLPPATLKILEALRAANGRALGASEIVDWIVTNYGHGLRRETVSRALGELVEIGAIDKIENGPFKTAVWEIIPTAPKMPESSL